MPRGRRRRGQRDIFNLFTGFGAIIVILMFLVLVGAQFNLNFQNEYVQLIPSLVLISVGIFGIGDTKGYMVMGGFMCLGIGFAYMTGQLNTMGILIPDLITPALTLQNIQLLLVVLSGIVGAVFSTN